MKLGERKTVRGLFIFPSGREVSGDITFDGRETMAYLEDSKHFSVSELQGKDLKCKLIDGMTATLVDCIALEDLGSGMRAGFGSYSFARIFPHFVVLGDRYFSSCDPVVSTIGMVVDDASTLFYDFDAFGMSIDPKRFVEDIVQANSIAFNRTINSGDDPKILYFTGKTTIITAGSAAGQLAVHHNPSIGVHSLKGIRLENSISSEWTFASRVLFEDAIEKVLELLRFFELIVGRPQNIESLFISEGVNDRPMLAVYWCMPPFRKPNHEDNKPHPAELLVSPIREADHFCRVFKSWIEREDTWKSARRRFSHAFGEQRRYEIDRLIASANMFDILPEGAVPTKVELTAQLAEAKKIAKDAFKGLPKTIERESVLSALGRLGNATLKHKVRHRAKMILDRIGKSLPNLESVTDEAVNCRNYYVHGGKKSFDYDSELGAVSFLTDTLEFVFGISDLIEAEWDLLAWANRGTSMSHPFGAYRVSYLPKFVDLQDLIKSFANKK